MSATLRSQGTVTFTRTAAQASPSPGLPVLDERTWNAFIGVTTAIIGNVLISFALNLQRYAHIRLHREQLERSRRWSKQAQDRKRAAGHGAIVEENGRSSSRNDSATESQRLLPDVSHRPAHQTRTDSGMSRHRDGSKFDQEQESYLRSPYWWAGMILMVTGEAGNFLAYGFAPASIVSPLGVVALISNCIIAPCLLHERFRQRDFWGVIVAIAGAVTIVLSVETDEKKMGPEEIWHALTRWEFELYLGITAAAIIALAWASPRYGHKTILIDLGLVGLFGEYTALSTKGVASLLSDTLWRSITFPVTYLLVFVLITTALMQIRYINRALQRFPSTQVIPTQFVLFTLSVIIGSAVLYRDFESTTPEHLVKFVGGCALTFLGVYLITHGRPPPRDDEEVNGVLGEESISLIDEETAGDAGEGRDVPSRPTIESGSIKSMSRQESFASSQTPSRLSAPGIGLSSSPMFGRTASDNSVLNNPWMTTPEILTPQAILERQESYGTGAGTFSSSVPDPNGSLEQYPDTPVRSAARRSMSRLFPSPLLTPLSSSLNAVVAENLRQGVDSPARRAAGFRSSTTTALPRAESLTYETTAPDIMSPVAEASPESSRFSSSARHRPHRSQDSDPGDPSPRKTRAKSLTETLRSLFKSKELRGRTKRGQGHARGGQENDSYDYPSDTLYDTTIP